MVQAQRLQLLPDRQPGSSHLLSHQAQSAQHIRLYLGVWWLVRVATAPLEHLETTALQPIAHLQLGQGT